MSPSNRVHLTLDVFVSPGTLATHWIADGLTLWKSPLTDSHLYTSAAYYSLLAQAPQELGIAISIVAVTGATTILWSLWDGRAGNLMFDGASLCNLSRTLYDSVQSDSPPI